MGKVRDWPDQTEDEAAESLARDMMKITRVKNEDKSLYKKAKAKLKEIAKAATETAKTT